MENSKNKSRGKYCIAISGLLDNDTPTVKFFEEIAKAESWQFHRINPFRRLNYWKLSVATLGDITSVILLELQHYADKSEKLGMDTVVFSHAHAGLATLIAAEKYRDKIKASKIDLFIASNLPVKLTFKARLVLFFAFVLMILLGFIPGVKYFSRFIPFGRFKLGRQKAYWYPLGAIWTLLEARSEFNKIYQNKKEFDFTLAVFSGMDAPISNDRATLRWLAERKNTKYYPVPYAGHNLGIGEFQEKKLRQDMIALVSGDDVPHYGF